MKECEDVVNAARKTGRKCLVGETVRFHALNLRVKKLFDEGEFGEPLYIEAHYVHDMRPVYEITPWRATTPQDLLVGGGCHPIDHVRWLCGEVEEVHCYSNRSDLTPEYSLDENFVLNLKFENGVIGRILDLHGCVEPPMPMMGFMLCGTKGSAYNNELVFERDGKQTREVLDGSREMQMAKDGVPAPDVEMLGHLDEIIRCLYHLKDCIQNDTDPMPDAVEGARTVAVSLAAWESARTGHPVKVRKEF